MVETEVQTPCTVVVLNTLDSNGQQFVKAEDYENEGEPLFSNREKTEL